MKKLKFITAFFITSFLYIAQPIHACTDFRLTAKDNTVLITRSMEFSADMGSNLRTSPRGRTFTSTLPDGKPGLTWKAKYGYLYLDGFNFDAAIDGMNEAGLSFEALYLPNFAMYQTLTAGHETNALFYLNIGDWILSNFKSLDELRTALPTITVFAKSIPGMGNMVFPLHFSVYEASGKGLVIEYVNGKLFTYENQIGVMTNSPTYNWHLINLRNYIHLAPVNPPAIMADGIQFAVTSQGFGMIGLPGDMSPPSRFVKITVLKSVTLPQENAAGLLNLAEHIINNVDIPFGLSREPNSGKYISESTEWVVFKDLTHHILYYRTYGDLSLHAVSMAKIDFSEKAPALKMPIADKEYINDVTDQFVKSIKQ